MLWLSGCILNGFFAFDFRKIVLATNIAESSITIDDVVYVIDCGKAKETSYDALNKLACLLPSWISKASAHQVCSTGNVTSTVTNLKDC